MEITSVELITTKLYLKNWLKQSLLNKSKNSIIFSNKNIYQHYMPNILYYSELLNLDLYKICLTIEIFDQYLILLIEYVNENIHTNINFNKIIRKINHITIITIIMIATKLEGNRNITKLINDEDEIINKKNTKEWNDIKSMISSKIIQQKEIELFKLFKFNLPIMSRYHDIEVITTLCLNKLNLINDENNKYFILIETIMKQFLLHWNLISNDLINIIRINRDIQNIELHLNNRLFIASGIALTMFYKYNLIENYLLFIKLCNYIGHIITANSMCIQIFVHIILCRI